MWAPRSTTDHSSHRPGPASALRGAASLARRPSFRAQAAGASAPVRQAWGWLGKVVEAGPPPAGGDRSDEIRPEQARASPACGALAGAPGRPAPGRRESWSGSGGRSSAPSACKSPSRAASSERWKNRGSTSARFSGEIRGRDHGTRDPGPGCPGRDSRVRARVRGRRSKREPEREPVPALRARGPVPVPLARAPCPAPRGMTAGTSRAVAKRSARGHGPRAAGVGPRRPSTGSGRRGGAARPVEIDRPGEVGV
jgi:hypothetical protein